MANSYLEFKGQDLRVNDLDLALVFSLAVRRWRALKGSVELISQWEEMLESAGPGLYDFDLGGFWASTDGQQQLVTLLDDVCSEIESEGDQMPGDRAAALLLTDRFQCKDRPTSDLVRTAREIQRFLKT